MKGQLAFAKKLTPKEVSKLVPERLRDIFSHAIMFTEPKSKEIKGLILTNGTQFLDQFQAMHDIAKAASGLFEESVTPEALIELKKKLEVLGL